MYTRTDSPLHPPLDVDVSSFLLTHKELIYLE